MALPYARRGFRKVDRQSNTPNGFLQSRSEKRRGRQTSFISVRRYICTRSFEQPRSDQAATELCRLIGREAVHAFAARFGRFARPRRYETQKQRHATRREASSSP